MTRLCVDLNVWCGAFLARAHGRAGTANQTIVEAVRRGFCDRGALSLVVSWGMLERLAVVLERDLNFRAETARDLTRAIAGYAIEGPSLTLGGVGVLPIHDAKDRHVLETAWSGGADLLATADLRGFIDASLEVMIADRIYRLQRADRSLVVAHPYEAAAWLRGEDTFTLGPRGKR